MRVEKQTDEELLTELAEAAVSCGMKAEDPAVKSFAYTEAGTTYGYLTRLLEYVEANPEEGDGA